MTEPWNHPRLTEREFQARYDQLLEQEAAQPISWWWLSFVGPSSNESGEPGEFLGACIVPGRGMLSALQVAGALDLTPKPSDVEGTTIPEELVLMVVSESYRLRLLDRGEAEIVQDKLDDWDMELDTPSQEREP